MDIEVISFNFAPEVSTIPQRSKSKYDVRIRDTILSLLTMSLQVPNRVLIYTCESVDNRHCQRQLLFDHWYKVVENEYLRFPFHLPESELIDTPVHGCVIVSKDYMEIAALHDYVINKLQDMIMQKYGA